MSDAPPNHLTDNDLLERIGALTTQLRNLTRDDAARAVERTLVSHVAEFATRLRARTIAIRAALAAPFEGLRRRPQ